jgi:hypothetical protein
MPEYTRRAAISAAAGASLAALGGAELAAADGARDGLHVGRVVSKPRPGALLVAITGGGECTVTAAASAYITRGVSGVQGSLEAFQPGEEVVWRGGIAGGLSQATEVQSLYREVHGTFTGIEADGRVRTSQGVLDVDGQVPAVEQVQSLQPGDSVHAEVWIDPQRQRPVLVVVNAD